MSALTNQNLTDEQPKAPNRLLKTLRIAYGPLLGLTLLLVTATNSAATLTVKSSTTQVRKGQPFKIYLVIAAQQSMNDLEVSFLPPTGFVVTEHSNDIPRALDSGSSYTVIYTLVPPSVWHESAPGSDTRERKIFVFNVAYTSQADGQPKQHYESVDLSVDYSTSPPLYLLLGLLGAILGNLIKFVTAQSDPKVSILQSVKDSFTAGKGGLLTSIAIAFVVLLTLSRDAIPTKGWYDSLALGAAVAVLSDEQLLAKIKKVVAI